MAADKKQKMLLGGLAVLILGMGSVWYFTRDTGTTSGVTFEERTGPKRRRQTATTQTKATRKKSRVRKTAKADPLEKKQRMVKKERRAGPKKQRKRGKRRIQKKKFAAPAA